MCTLLQYLGRKGFPGILWNPQESPGILRNPQESSVSGVEPVCKLRINQQYQNLGYNNQED